MKVELVLPVHNEALVLAEKVSIIGRYIASNNVNGYGVSITIADSCSSDETMQLSKKMIRERKIDRYLFVSKKGKGRALRTAMSQSESDVICYMDIDLSTDLKHFFTLIDLVVAGQCHVAIGSRLLPASRVVGRSMLREVTSRGYNFLVKVFFPRSRVSDMQCGFKAFVTSKVKALLPLVKNNHWFFDTEVILLAERNGLNVGEVPVTWVDDPISSVNIVKVAFEDLIGLIRLRLTSHRLKLK